MNLDALLETLPEYAKDIKLNFSTHVRQQTELSAQQVWGTVFASAMATRSGELIAATALQARETLTPEALEAAKAAATIMGMNNVYYRFLHLTKNEKYATLPAKLRMNILRGHGVDVIDFELWCTAVSAINACGACVDSHEKVLREKGVAEEKILAAVRVAAIMNSLANIVETEKALAASKQPSEAVA